MSPSELEAPPEELDTEQSGADVTTNTGPRLPVDRLRRRLLWGGLVSALVNLMLWRIAAQVVHSRIPAPPTPLTFRRIILPPRPRPRPPKRVIRKVVRRIVKPPPVVKRKPVIPHIVRHVTPPKPVVTPHPPRRRPPPAAHQHVMTMKRPAPARHTALPDGHAPVGVPIARQNTGEGHNADQAPAPQPQPQPVPQPTPQPVPLPEPKPEPKPAPPPQPTGPTQDAQPSHQSYPDIPDDLKTGDYKSFVRVKVEVAADGSFTVSLVTSSGNEDIDQRVLEALKRWAWKPALQNGQPVSSTQRFRFNFEVQ